MKVAPLASALLFIAAPAIAQNSPEDNDKRSVQAYFYELTPLKPGSDFAASLTLPRGYHAAMWTSGLGNTRVMAVAPDGSVYVSRRSEADIIRLMDADRDGFADGPPTVIVNRPGLHGLTIHDGMLYFMDANGMIYRITYDSATGQAAPLYPPRDPMPEQAARSTNVPLALTRQETRTSGSARLTVGATAFTAKGPIPRDHSEYGLGISPALNRSAVPNAASYAILVEDPDDAAKPVVHWVAWNVPAGTVRLPEGRQERDRLNGRPLEGIMQGASGRGTVSWYGPRPPKGDKPHHYHFQMLALDRQLDLPLGATRDQLLAAATGYVIATGDLVGTYGEPK